MKITKEYMDARKAEMKRKKKARAKYAKLLKIAVGLAVIGSVVYGIVDGAKWSHEHPEAYQKLTSEKVGFITAEDQQNAIEATEN